MCDAVRLTAVAGALCALVSAPLAQAQQALAPLSPQFGPRLVAGVVTDLSQEVAGVVRDASGQPLAGVVVSALGTASVYALSGRDGRFLLRSLPAGPYLVRAHLEGYVPARSRVLRVGSAQRLPLMLTLQRISAEEPTLAGSGTAPLQVDSGDKAPDSNPSDHAEVAWRLRHSKRSVLKDAVDGLALAGGVSPAEAAPTVVGRALGGSARFASTLLPDLSLNGQLNLLTSASFNRPQDLFSADARVPQGMAYLALETPSPGGEWRMRGTATQGDLSSWIVSGAYARDVAATHAYEVGASYAMQRYEGGNVEALAALRDGSRNVGTLYAYDNWNVAPRVRVSYGARYADYDYLRDQRLFSPRVAVTVQPFTGRRNLGVHASATRNETAPGAVEFVAPAGGVWLPPERTFSPVGGAQLVPQRVDHVEAGADHQWGPVVVSARAFRQQTQNQVLGAFGESLSTFTSATGHYHVGAIGDFDAVGWATALEAHVGAHTRAAVDYQQVSAAWSRGAASSDMAIVLPSSVFRRADRAHSLTGSVESAVAATDTRVLVVVRLDQAASREAGASPALATGRFQVQVNQSLPFLGFTNAQWEALVAVRNMFYDPADGASIYDELLVVRPPTRVLGGVTVRF